jgi:hypothetical protein
LKAKPPLRRSLVRCRLTNPTTASTVPPRRNNGCALKYRITSLATLERIALFALQSGSGCWMGVAVDEQLRQRPAYQEGALTDSPDLSGYEPEPPPEHE